MTPIFTYIDALFFLWFQKKKANILFVPWIAEDLYHPMCCAYLPALTWIGFGILGHAFPSFLVQVSHHHVVKTSSCRSTRCQLWRTSCTIKGEVVKCFAEVQGPWLKQSKAKTKWCTASSNLSHCLVIVLVVVFRDVCLIPAIGLLLKGFWYLSCVLFWLVDTYHYFFDMISYMSSWTINKPNQTATMFQWFLIHPTISIGSKLSVISIICFDTCLTNNQPT